MYAVPVSDLYVGWYIESTVIVVMTLKLVLVLVVVAVSSGASCHVFFFEKKTAYEMRISDWSSDVCSSDLFFDVEAERQSGVKRVAHQRRGARIHEPRAAVRTAEEGRFLNASLRQPFTDNMIYEVIVQVARITTIRLEPGEQITSLEASDSATIQLATSQVGSGGSLAHVIVLKPNDLFETNNLQIVTTRRLYLIDLVMADPGSEAYHRLVTWTYPTLHLPLPATPQPQYPQSQYAQPQSAQSQYAQPAPPRPPAAPPIGYQGEMMQVASASTEAAPRPTRLWDLNLDRKSTRLNSSH